jgi:uncharacterized protein DUF3592
MKTKVSDHAAIIACCVLAFASLTGAIYHTLLLLPLLDHGKWVEAVVVGIDNGAKGSKWAVYQFDTDIDQQMTSRDIFQMYFIRLHKGDYITVIYDPNNKRMVTADLGLWNWQGTAIFLFGFVFLASLGVLILRYEPKQN